MGDDHGWSEGLNSAVRAIVTLALAGGFVLGFAVLKLISGEVYTAVVTGVIGYWFAARQGEQAAKAAVQAIADAKVSDVAVKSTNGTVKPPDGTTTKPPGG